MRAGFGFPTLIVNTHWELNATLEQLCAINITVNEHTISGLHSVLDFVWYF